ncbi:MAG TPA: hypothetical protein VFY32_05520 [Solirubrobacteraceae bacterium]|nr:hypothetical protein [Solirubrobacteraceae bacterium]
MPDLELTRDPADRRLYVLDGVGSLRLEGWGKRRATLDAKGRSWHAVPAGFWKLRVEVTDAAGSPVAQFEPRSMRRGGVLRVGGRELTIEPASKWKERYALKDGERELAQLESKSWGKQPVRVTVEDPSAVEPLLLLFTAFIVRRLAEDSAAAATAVSGA